MRIIKITEQNAHYWHRRIWLWLEKNGKKRKEDWPGWKYLEPCPHHCVACFIGELRVSEVNKRKIVDKCKFCPIIKWAGFASGGYTNCSAPCERMEYGNWRIRKSSRNIKRTAFIVANLEWK